MILRLFILFIENCVRNGLGPKSKTSQFGVLFRFPLAKHFNLKRELLVPGDTMDWSEIGRSFSAHLASTPSKLGLPPRLVAVLLYLQHAYDCSDEIAVDSFVQSSYWQFFTGEMYLKV